MEEPTIRRRAGPVERTLRTTYDINKLPRAVQFKHKINPGEDPIRCAGRGTSTARAQHGHSTGTARPQHGHSTVTALGSGTHHPVCGPGRSTAERTRGNRCKHNQAQTQVQPTGSSSLQQVHGYGNAGQAFPIVTWTTGSGHATPSDCHRIASAPISTPISTGTRKCHTSHGAWGGVWIGRKWYFGRARSAVHDDAEVATLCDIVPRARTCSTTVAALP